LKKLGEGGFGVVIEAKKKVDVRILKIIFDVRMTQNSSNPVDLRS